MAALEIVMRAAGLSCNARTLKHESARSELNFTIGIRLTIVNIALLRILQHLIGAGQNLFRNGNSIFFRNAFVN